MGRLARPSLAFPRPSLVAFFSRPSLAFPPLSLTDVLENDESDDQSADQFSSQVAVSADQFSSQVPASAVCAALISSLSAGHQSGAVVVTSLADTHQQLICEPASRPISRQTAIHRYSRPADTCWSNIGGMRSFSSLSINSVVVQDGPAILANSGPAVGANNGPVAVNSSPRDDANSSPVAMTNSGAGDSLKNGQNGGSSPGASLDNSIKVADANSCPGISSGPKVPAIRRSGANMNSLPGALSNSRSGASLNVLLPGTPSNSSPSMNSLISIDENRGVEMSANSVIPMSANSGIAMSANSGPVSYLKSKAKDLASSIEFGTNRETLQGKFHLS